MPPPVADTPGTPRADDRFPQASRRPHDLDRLAGTFLVAYAGMAIPRLLTAAALSARPTVAVVVGLVTVAAILGAASDSRMLRLTQDSEPAPNAAGLPRSCGLCSSWEPRPADGGRPRPRTTAHDQRGNPGRGPRQSPGPARSE